MSSTFNLHATAVSMHVENSQDEEEKDCISEISYETETVDVDYILDEYVKPIGRWQLLIVALTAVSTTASPTVGIFILATPYFRCRLSDTYEGILKNSSFHEAARFSGPWPTNSKLDNNYYSGQYGCYHYEYPGNLNSKIEYCTNGYNYSIPDYQYPDTVVKEWDLVCQRSWLIPFSNTLFLLGMASGFYIGGYLGSRIGRRKSIIFLSFFHMVFALSTSLSTGFWTFAIQRYLTALCLSGKTTSAIILINELTTAEFRTVMLTLHFLFIDTLNRIYVPLLGYIISNWRLFNFCSMLMSMTVLVYPFIIPESPRWLLSHDNVEESLNQMYKGYLFNKPTGTRSSNKINFKREERVSAIFPDQIAYHEQFKSYSLWRKFIHHTHDLFKFQTLPSTTTENPSKMIQKSQIKLLFSTKQNTGNTIICIGLYVIHNMLHFGLMFYLRFMRSSVYAVNVINVLLVLPAFLVTYFLPKLFRSRKLPLYTCYSFASAFALFGGVYQYCFEPSNDYVLIGTSSLAFLCTTSAAVLMFVYVPELFASDVRAQGLGITMGTGRLFSLLVDFINEIDTKFGHGLPLIIYGVMFVFQIVLFLIAPESAGERIPDKTLQRKNESPWGSAQIDEMEQSI